MAENCCCCPANWGELRPGLLVVMPDAMGLPPGFMGLLALAIGFPRTCGQKGWLSPEAVTLGDMESKKKAWGKGGGENEAGGGQERKRRIKGGHLLCPECT